MTLRAVGISAYYLSGALLLGTTLRQQTHLLDYFYEYKLADWIPVFIIFISAFLLSLKYNNPQGTVALIINALFLSVALFGSNLIFWLYGYIDWANIIAYFMLSCLAASLGIFVKHKTFRFSPVLIILASAFGFSVGLATSFVWLVLTTATLYLFLAPLYLHWRKSALWLATSLFTVLVHVRVPDDNRMFESQKKYYDKVLYSAQTPYHQIDITTWKGNEWFYYDNINQFSSIDHSLYYEPMVHPAMKISALPKNILVIGGENGLLIKEILKHKTVEQVDLIPLDTALLNIATEQKWFTNLNKNALESHKLRIKNGEVFRLLAMDSAQYDLIFVDVPDPVDIELSQYYTVEFYKKCNWALKHNGLLVTQAGSPYLATVAYYTIQHTIKAAGFSTLPLHNQVLTIGEWGWIMGAKGMQQDKLNKKAGQCTFENIDTRWLNHEGMQMIMSFGKPPVRMNSFEINTLKKPVIHEYYRSGTWTF